MGEIKELIIQKFDFFKSEEITPLFRKKFGSKMQQSWVWSFLNRLGQARK